jgi:uncharacterized RDD family membrane protein YckC
VKENKMMAKIRDRLKKKSFLRRGTALGIDMVVVALISIPVMILVTLVLSLLAPSKFENPVRQVGTAIREHTPFTIKLEMFTELQSHEAEPGVLVIGEGKGWIQEIFAFYAYFVLCFRYGGRTLGKRWLGLRVIKRNGHRLSWWNAFERAHGYVFSASILSVGFLQVLWDPNGSTMHDRIADTAVVRAAKSGRRRRADRAGPYP